VAWRAVPAQPVPAQVVPAMPAQPVSESRVPVGTLGSGPIAWVDPGGVVTDADGRTTLRWWVLAEDRLHVIEDEAAVRQRLVDDGPVVETAVRVPGGDIVGTVFAA